MSDRFVVRKLDTEDPTFYVVDSRVPGYELICEASIVSGTKSSLTAHARAKELNDDGQ